MRATDIQEALHYFDGVKRCNENQYMARCPCHDDRKQSLSIGRGEKGIVIKCHAGCDTGDILARVGLKPSDLFYEQQRKAQERPQVVAIYDYPDGVQKLRYADKHFGWRRPDGKGGWIWNRQGVRPSLYIAGELTGTVAVVEGEKDADNLYRLGLDAVSGADGAGPGKWKSEYTEQLKGIHICIFSDNDAVGKAYAQEIAAALHGVAASVRLLDLSHIWPEIPEHGDVSDLIAAFGDEMACELIAQFMTTTPEWTPPTAEEDPFLSCFKPLSSFTEEEATWLVPGWIPEGQITLIAADGGLGKTTFWTHIIASVSSGKRCILDPPGYTRPAQRVAFLTTEDSVRKKLRKKLREGGANLSNIITPDFAGDKDSALRGLKFGSQEVERFIRYFKPALCVFDPVQGFIPPAVSMAARNQMRDCMAPLVALGEETGTAFLVVCHSNKRKGAWGRDRISDSADLWDIARSVLMMGYTDDDGVRYLSNEKNNYSTLADTLLFTIDGNGQIHAEGTTWKRDREYTQEASFAVSTPKRDGCKSWLLQQIDGADGQIASKVLEEMAKQAGYSYRTMRRAKDELKRDGVIKYHQAGGLTDKAWFVQRADSQFTELTDNDAVTMARLSLSVRDGQVDK